MNRKRWILISVSLIVMGSPCVFCWVGAYLAVYLIDNDDSRYRTYGRDYVTHFGEGRFQILRTPDGSRELMDLDGDTRFPDVADWYEDGDVVYVSSTAGRYFLLWLANGKSQEYESFEQMPSDHQRIARRLRLTR